MTKLGRSQDIFGLNSDKTHNLAAPSYSNYHSSSHALITVTMLNETMVFSAMGFLA